MTSAQYLGLSLRDLRMRLGSGTSLGRIADSVHGRSRRGLIDALIAPRLARLGPLIASGRLTPAQQSRRALSIEAVVILIVDRVHPRVARRHVAHRRARARRAPG